MMYQYTSAAGPYSDVSVSKSESEAGKSGVAIAGNAFSPRRRTNRVGWCSLSPWISGLLKIGWIVGVCSLSMVREHKTSCWTGHQTCKALPEWLSCHEDERCPCHHLGELGDEKAGAAIKEHGCLA